MSKFDQLVLSFWATIGVGAMLVERWWPAASQAWGNDMLMFVFNFLLAALTPFVILKWWLSLLLRVVDERWPETRAG